MHKALSVKSRVRGDFHARFCERVRVKLPHSTRPCPHDDWSLAQDMIDAGNKFIEAMEAMSKADVEIRQNGFDNICNNN